jgi:hypothetical protein
MKTVSQKMGVKENSRVLFINAPIDAIDGMKLPDVEKAKGLKGEFDYLHLFVINQIEFNEHFCLKR